MSKALITESILTGIADAIRGKTSETATMKPTEMAEKIAGISGGGSDEAARAIINRSITEYEDKELKKLGTYSFYGCTALKSIDFPACTLMGQGCFGYCTALKNVNLPVCTSIGSASFMRCQNLGNIDLPACTSIGTNCFDYCIKLTDVNLPVCTKLSSYAFRDCKQLEQINLPVCTSIADDAFDGCTALTEIHFAAANQATIEALSRYASKFGATNATIYFDL